MGLDTNSTLNNRWYDKYPDFRIMLDKLREMKKWERDKIILEIRDIINNRDMIRFILFVISWKKSKRKYCREYKEKQQFVSVECQQTLRYYLK